MRAFIALDISGSVKMELAALVETFKKTEADVKWVSTENLHLTLKFLGEINERKIPEIQEALRKIADKQRPFFAHLAGVGGFPTLERARVLWLGIDEGEDVIKSLAEKIEEVMISLGCRQEERPFSSHLTIGRVKSHSHWESVVDVIKKIPFSSASRIEMRQINLYQSILSPKGPTYHLVKYVPLT